MYVWSLHVSRVKINRVRLPILLVVSWALEINISPSPFAPENLVSLDGFGSPVPRQPAHVHTQAESDAYLWDSSRFPRRRPFIYLNRHAPSSQSRVYRVTQLRTDGVYSRESAGTGPVNLKVVPKRVLTWQVIMDQVICASFPHPLLYIGMKWAKSTGGVCSIVSLTDKGSLGQG